MSETTEIDFGPLAGLIGSWMGEEGVDIAPEPDGKETIHSMRRSRFRRSAMLQMLSPKL